jgi:hypothetical protein
MIVGKLGIALGRLISSKNVMSVAVSHHLKRGNNGFNTVYVGTEPSAIYRFDNGISWEKTIYTP